MALHHLLNELMHGRLVINNLFPDGLCLTVRQTTENRPMVSTVSKTVCNVKGQLHVAAHTPAVMPKAASEANV